MGGGGGGGRGLRWYPKKPPVCMCSIVREQFVILLFSFLFALSPPPLFFLGGGGEFFYLPLTKSFSFFSFLKFIIENRSCMYMYEYWVSPRVMIWTEDEKEKYTTNFIKVAPPPFFFNWSMERRSMYYRGERSGEWMRQVDKMELQRDQFHLINLLKRRRTNPPKKKSKHSLWVEAQKKA